MSDVEKTSDQSSQPNDPPIEVTPNKGRRVFTAEYKRRILEELDRAEHGQAARILRREGLYAATVANWRKQRDRGLKSRKRGPKPDPDSSLRRENEELLKRVERLEKRLKQAETIIEVQKKSRRY